MLAGFPLMAAFDHKISRPGDKTARGLPTSRGVRQRTVASPGTPGSSEDDAASLTKPIPSVRASLQWHQTLNRSARVAQIAQLSRALQQRSISTGSRATVQRATTNIVSPDSAKGKEATKTTVVEATAESTGFDDTTIAVNTVRPLARVATPRTPAYIANIITTASGKDKSFAQVAAQYAAEAFDTAADAARRFALIVLANREEKPSAPAADQTSALHALSTEQAASVTAFPAAAGRALWRRRWRAGPDADHLESKTVAEIRAILDGASKPAEARDAANTAARAEGLPPTVPNQARNKVREMPQTSTYVGGFTRMGYTPFVHVGDADAVTFKATESTDRTGPEKSLFSRYDALIAAAPKAEALAGGYRFAARPGDKQPLPAHAAGAGDTGAGLMAQTEQAIKVSELDVRVRSAMQGVEAGMPYFPEPNIAVRGDLYTQPGVSFGDTGREWLKLKTSLLAQGKAFRGKQKFEQFGGKEITPEDTAKRPFCEFVAGAYTTMTGLFGSAVKYKSIGVRTRSGWVEQTPTHILVFRDRATIERTLGKAWSQSKLFEFNPKAALVTDVGRFDQPYVETSGVGAGKSGTAYTAGKTDPLAVFDPARAHQSHAQWGAIKSSLEYVYRLESSADQDWLQSAMRVFLPQSLFAELSGSGGGTLAERTTRASETLDSIKGQLGHFKAFTTAVSAEIANPVQLQARAVRQQGRADAMTARHKADAVAARLKARGVPDGFIGLLDQRDRLGIWDVATSTTKAGAAANVAAALKAIGDTIADFLAKY